MAISSSKYNTTDIIVINNSNGRHYGFIDYSMISNMSMHDAFEDDNLEKLKYLHTHFGLIFPENGNYYIDAAIENGNLAMVKLLVNRFKCRPSLYAKQIAMIKGYDKLVEWLNSHATERNNIGIDVVHKRHDDTLNKIVWSDIIPQQFRCE